MQAYSTEVLLNYAMHCIGQTIQYNDLRRPFISTTHLTPIYPFPLFPTYNQILQKVVLTVTITPTGGLPPNSSIFWLMIDASLVILIEDFEINEN